LQDHRFPEGSTGIHSAGDASQGRVLLGARNGQNPAGGVVWQVKQEAVFSNRGIGLRGDVVWGVGASRVPSLFEQGKKHAPCIIFNRLRSMRGAP